MAILVGVIIIVNDIYSVPCRFRDLDRRLRHVLTCKMKFCCPWLGGCCECVCVWSKHSVFLGCPDKPWSPLNSSDLRLLLVTSNLTPTSTFLRNNEHLKSCLPNCSRPRPCTVWRRKVLDSTLTSEISGYGSVANPEKLTRHDLSSENSAIFFLHVNKQVYNS